MDSIVTASTFDVSKIVVGTARVNQMTKSKSANINYGDRPFIIRVPKLSVPLIWDKDESGSKFTLEMSFRGMDKEAAEMEKYETLLNAGDGSAPPTKPNTPITDFYKLLCEVDKCLLEKAQERSIDWFKKQMNREACVLLYAPIIKAPNDPAYAPTFKTTMYKRNDKFECDIFDENKQKIEIVNPHTLKGCNAMALMKCTGIWITGAKFGTTWKLEQLRVFPRTRDIANNVDSLPALNADDVSVPSLTFSTPKTIANGGRTIYVNNGDNRPLKIRTPKMHVPFGISVFHDEHGSKFSLELSFRDSDTDGEIGAFNSMIQELESRIKSEAATSGWFNCKGGANFLSVIKQNNTQYPAVIKFNLPSSNGQILVDIVDENTGEKIVVDDVTMQSFKQAKARVEAVCTGIWNHANRYGMSFRATKVILSPSATITGFTLDDDEDEEDTVVAQAYTSDDDV